MVKSNQVWLRKESTIKTTVAVTCIMITLRQATLLSDLAAINHLTLRTTL